MLSHSEAVSALSAAVPERVSPRAQTQGVATDYYDLIDDARILSFPPFERARQERLQDLEDERLERCRGSSSNFDQCFFFDMQAAQGKRDDAVSSSSSVKEGLRRRAPPTW